MTDPTLGQGTAPPPRERDGRSEIERLAVGRLLVDVAAMPASDVVQLVLWPDTVAGWARASAIAPAVAYNMLARFKPYRRVRERLAHRLDVPGFVLDHLIDAPRPLPAAQRAVPSAAAGLELPAPPPPAAIEPTVRLPAVRDGSNPIERRAVWRVWHDVAALPASVLVQIALFPETLAEWARRIDAPAAMVYAMLAGSAPHRPLRAALARRLAVAPSSVDVVVDTPRREPEPPRPPALEPPSLDDATGSLRPGSSAPSPDRTHPTYTDDDPQLGLF